MSRFIDTIVIHCSATKEGKSYCAKDIDDWHRQRGFNEIGYHYVIGINGEVEIGRNIDKIGAHVSGHNTGSIGICYIGGLDEKGEPKDTRTEKQKFTIEQLLQDLLYKYPTIYKIMGHRDFGVNKSCPCFDAIKEYKNLLEKICKLRKQ